MRKVFDHLGLVDVAVIGDPVRNVGVADQDVFGPSTSRLVAAR